MNSGESIKAGTLAEAMEEMGEEAREFLKEKLREERDHTPEAEDEVPLVPVDVGSEGKLTNEDVEEICRRFAVWTKDKVRSAKANHHNLGYLQQRIRERLYRLITRELPRVGLEVGARAHGRKEPYLIEKWRYETALKFYFDSLKGTGLTHVNATLREQFSVQAVARADALLEALGYDVDVELD